MLVDFAALRETGEGGPQGGMVKEFGRHTRFAWKTRDSIGLTKCPEGYVNSFGRINGLQIATS